MQKAIGIATLGLVVGLCACDRGGGDTGAGTQEGGHGHAHDEEEGHHGEERHHGEDEDHHGDEGHHRGEPEEHHGGDEGHGGEHGHHDEPDYAEEGTVDVPEDGTDFEPPVPTDRLPGGAWYCDMGKAPWAAMAKPEDGCPLEDVPLKQK